MSKEDLINLKDAIEKLETKLSEIEKILKDYLLDKAKQDNKIFNLENKYKELENNCHSCSYRNFRTQNIINHLNENFETYTSLLNWFKEFIETKKIFKKESISNVVKIVFSVLTALLQLGILYYIIKGGHI